MTCAVNGAGDDTGGDANRSLCMGFAYCIIDLIAQGRSCHIYAIAQSLAESIQHLSLVGPSLVKRADLRLLLLAEFHGVLERAQQRRQLNLLTPSDGKPMPAKKLVLSNCLNTDDMR